MNLHITKVNIDGKETPAMVYYEASPPLVRIDTIEIDQKRYKPDFFNFKRIQEECMSDYTRTKPTYDVYDIRKRLNR